MSVCCECSVLSGRGLCDELITRPEESYWLWCVVECDLETSRTRRPWPAWVAAPQKKEIKSVSQNVAVLPCTSFWVVPFVQFPILSLRFSPQVWNGEPLFIAKITVRSRCLLMWLSWPQPADFLQSVWYRQTDRQTDSKLSHLMFLHGKHVRPATRHLYGASEFRSIPTLPP
jgi:hypothetical protein